MIFYDFFVFVLLFEFVVDDVYMYYYVCCDVFDRVKGVGVEVGLCY